MKTPKYKIGDKILVRGEIHTINSIEVCIGKLVTTIYYFYCGETIAEHKRRWEYAIHEDAIVLATRYEVGDKVWCMLNNAIYQCTVKEVIRTGRYYVESPRIRVHINESDLHPTKESLIKSIPCHDLCPDLCPDHNQPQPCIDCIRNLATNMTI